MPKSKQTEQTQTQTQVFLKEDWLEKVKQIIMQEPWGAAILKATNTLRLEVVRIGDTNNIMVRISGSKPGNAIKLTRREHIDSLIEIAEAIVNNYNNLREKLDAIKELLPSGGKRTFEEV